jgi:hypothetical protein
VQIGCVPLASQTQRGHSSTMQVYDSVAGSRRAAVSGRFPVFARVLSFQKPNSLPHPCGRNHGLQLRHRKRLHQHGLALLSIRMLHHRRCLSGDVHDRHWVDLLNFRSGFNAIHLPAQPYVIRTNSGFVSIAFWTDASPVFACPMTVCPKRRSLCLRSSAMRSSSSAVNTRAILN